MIAKDGSGNEGSNEETYIVLAEDDPSLEDEVECRISTSASGLSGSAVTPSLTDQALDMI
ncbi:hypothetical protein C0585_04570 [Candidatus Woesearchaeota archaeon]|nr:MAG: hypothetical protein C0585_04570 [Candidatus Woesearchaeota archaeon]